MPFKYRWHIQGRVMLVEGYGDIELEEFEKLARLELPDQILNEKMHVIILSQEIQSTPPMQQLAKLDVSDKRGWLIFVSTEDNALGRFIASVAMQVLGIEVRFVNTLQDAQALLKRVDLTLAGYNFPTDIDQYPILEHLE